MNLLLSLLLGTFNYFFFQFALGHDILSNTIRGLMAFVSCLFDNDMSPITINEPVSNMSHDLMKLWSSKDD